MQSKELNGLQAQLLVRLLQSSLGQRGGSQRRKNSKGIARVAPTFLTLLSVSKSSTIDTGATNRK